MRLGRYRCRVRKSSIAGKIYSEGHVYERHRHRYEFNSAFKKQFKEKGMVFSGINPGRDLVEMIELKEHPWFLAVQFHPEFRSRPEAPHPLFSGFIEAAAKNAR
jgi:CTP synthase